ncbi:MULTISPECIES: hypothetical protein [Gammaproteobacteria]|uniref:hypothetical protein n=1 Tax=Gammaproteobacteria TaxID=1236 RepID=UPI000DD07BF6|nr:MULTISPECIES: hypothetical protein [Gammaproteobacteria]RTE85931.1 hypothetical protein DQX04_10840 [Aliidiomarina sp. B3213]TCZ90070.1 hypothetical protein EYQ95_09625 [Lysobacter sp. N42]
MRTLGFCSMILICFSVCGEEYFSNDEIVSDSLEAVHLCLKEYSELFESGLSEEVDRVYVHFSPEVMGVIFTRGEAGSFGERSNNYRAFLSCGVSMSPSFQIYFLGSPSLEPLIELSGANDFDNALYSQAFRELMFVWDGDKFNFHDIKISSVSYQ